MNVKIKQPGFGGYKRTAIKGKIKEIDINEDILHPEKESVKIFFKGEKSSGIIELSTSEAEDLIESINGRIGLIKGIKKINI